MSDLRYALRALTSRPGPTAIVVLTLAVAIAATTVIYSAIDVVWSFIPVQSSRVVYVAATDARVVQSEGAQRSVVLRSRVSVPDLADWSARASTIDEFAGVDLDSANLTGLDIPIRVSLARATTNITGLWGLAPVLGRGFRAEEGHTGANPTTLLSHGFWQRQFSSDSGVLGRSLLIDNVGHTVVGVLPPEAGTGLFKDVDLFVPLVVDTLRSPRDRRTMLVTARLKPGVSFDQATADLDGVARQLRVEHPETNQHIGAVVLPLIEASGFNIRVLLSILGLIALLVLVMACANVAGVIVAQSLSRRREMAIRSALGASRFDGVRQIMLEGLMMCAIAAAAGLVLAAWSVDALRWLAGDAFGFAEIRVSTRVLAAGLLTALVAPVGFGLLPALRMAAPDPQEVRDGARAAGATLRGRRVRTIIVALQATAAIVLMLQIGILVRTTWALDNIAPGFDPQQVLSFRVGLSGERASTPQAITRFSADLLSRLRALPGVVSAGMTDRLPVADSETTARLTVDGAPLVPLASRPVVVRSAIAGNYLETLRIPVRRGRVFSDAEMTDGAAVALVNEEAVRRFWPQRDPIGARIALDSAPGREAWAQVVGVVGNLRNSDIDQGTLPQVYLPASQMPSDQLAVVVKAGLADPLQLVPAIRAQVAEIDRDQPIHDVASMPQVLYADMAGTYVLAAMLTAIGLISLCLSAAGVYGIVAQSVIQRRREIGVRIALGARPGAVVRMMLAHGARPVAAGSGVGLLLALIAATGVAAAVPEADASDPLNYLAVVLTITVVTLTASYFPARRAATIDPIAALRQQ